MFSLAPLAGLLLSSLVAAGPAVGDSAADFTLSDLDGKSVALDSLTDRGPVVLVVLRGFPGYQCALCSRQAGDFLSKAADFEEAGATLAFIYPADNTLGPAGTQAKANEFFDGRTLPDNAVVLLDPGYQFTDAYGLRWNAPNETAYPSTFVIDRNGRITSATVSESHGGRARAATILEAVKALP